MKSIVILISGRGSNMESLLAAVADRSLPVRVAAVVANRAAAKGLETAAAAGIATHVVDHKSFAGREDFDAALAAVIDSHAPDLVVLAGFMRILSDGFVRHFAGRLINIHPSLLPSFPGLHTHQRALDEGVRVHGCSVLDDDDAARLAARVLAQEHRVYPLAVRWFAEGRLQLADGKVRFAAPQDADGALISPCPLS